MVVLDIKVSQSRKRKHHRTGADPNAAVIWSDSDGDTSLYNDENIPPTASTEDGGTASSRKLFQQNNSLPPDSGCVMNKDVHRHHTLSDCDRVANHSANPSLTESTQTEYETVDGTKISRECANFKTSSFKGRIFDVCTTTDRSMKSLSSVDSRISRKRPRLETSQRTAKSDQSRTSIPYTKWDPDISEIPLEDPSSKGFFLDSCCDFLSRVGDGLESGSDSAISTSSDQHSRSSGSGATVLGHGSRQDMDSLQPHLHSDPHLTSFIAPSTQVSLASVCSQ